MTGTHCHTAGAKSKENEYTIMIASAPFFVNPLHGKGGAESFGSPYEKQCLCGQIIGRPPIAAPLQGSRQGAWLQSRSPQCP